jgi:formate hydrogenlyase transcriptional activator
MNFKNVDFESPEFNHLLSLSSLFGKDFSIDWLIELTGKKSSEVLSIIESGIKKGWLKGMGQGLYQFRDLKIQKFWLDHLTEEEKTNGHRQIVDILIKELSDDDHKAYKLSHHLLKLENSTEDCRWLMKAANYYLKAYLPENAIQCYSKILADLSIGKSNDEDLIFCEAAIQYSKISTARHNTIYVLSLLNSAIGRAKRLGEKKFYILLQMHAAKNEWLLSRYSRALKRFERGLALINDLNDPTLHHSIINFKIFFLYWQGRFQEAVNIYEKIVPDISKFPKGNFPLLAGMTVAHCYVQTGKVTEGLGMLDAIHRHCLEKKDLYLASNAAVTTGAILVDFRLIQESLEYLEAGTENAKLTHNDFMRILGTLTLSYAYYLIDDKKSCQTYFHEFLRFSGQSQVNAKVFSYFLEICLAMKKGDIPIINGLNLENEIDQAEKGGNVYMKGIAYKTRALLQESQGVDRRKVIQSLNLALKYLRESGHIIEISRILSELARNFLFLGDEKKADEMSQEAAKVISLLNEKMVPTDLKYLRKKHPLNKNILNEIFDLSKNLMSATENKQLFQRILSSANQILGAERGALFSIEDSEHSFKLKLTATRNLDYNEIMGLRFRLSMTMIEKTVKLRKGHIMGSSNQKRNAISSENFIRSCIAVPIVFKNQVIGALYHDNRLRSTAFDEFDLQILTYIASLAGFALEQERIHKEIDTISQGLIQAKPSYKEKHFNKPNFPGIVGQDPVFISVLNKVNMVAQTDATVLIFGESGVGKELIAKAIHQASVRKEKPFIPLNCSTFPETLIMSELFGHEKGAFTGAIRQKLGRLEIANGGTLFLDEIDTLSSEMQIKLLRVLQDKRFERIGGNKTIHSNFRLIAVTNQDLPQLIIQKVFRLDLYYRINVFPIHVPPLRERKDDIPLLSRYLLKKIAWKFGKVFDEISMGEMEKLVTYDWPGNVRELENTIERGIILNSGPNFKVPDDFKISFTLNQEINDKSLKGNERRHILWVLEKTGWKVRGLDGAAMILEIPPSTLEFKMKKLNIKRPKTFRK